MLFNSKREALDALADCVGLAAMLQAVAGQEDAEAGQYAPAALGLLERNLEDIFQYMNSND